MASSAADAALVFHFEHVGRVQIERTPGPPVRAAELGMVEAQLKLVREQGSRAEIDRWNRILTAEKPTFNVKPNEFLVEMAKGRRGRATL